MGRWRPPAEKSSPYITPEGAETMKAALADLWSLRRRDVVPALSAAAAEGDRSENAEYIYRKKQLAEIDRKIRYFSKRLDVMKVIAQLPANQDRIYFGAWVTVEDEQGTARSYRIVGADETSGSKGYISIDSPMARALIRRSLGDTVTLELPNGSTTVEIIGVRYRP